MWGEFGFVIFVIMERGEPHPNRHTVLLLT